MFGVFVYYVHASCLFSVHSYSMYKESQKILRVQKGQHLSLNKRKSVSFYVSDQIYHSFRKRLETLNIRLRKRKQLYYPCSENKGNDQLCRIRKVRLIRTEDKCIKYEKIPMCAQQILRPDLTSCVNLTCYFDVYHDNTSFWFNHLHPTFI